MSRRTVLTQRRGGAERPPRLRASSASPTTGASWRTSPTPPDPATFRACKLDFGERERHAGTYALHADLLRLRRETSAFTAQGARRMHGAVLGPHAACAS
jgi:hypothetical protein